MRTEEQVLLPIATRVLTHEDWRAIDREFESNRDPLTGREPDKEFAELFRRIVRLLPAPLGVGPEAA
ncbi:MAG TPA: hypothetical protein VFR86_26450 [Burkholderiaceae bacterium]|nr:hypothetical protein [Burkholderiaceae bacterium]